MASAAARIALNPWEGGIKAQMELAKLSSEFKALGCEKYFPPPPEPDTKTRIPWEPPRTPWWQRIPFVSPFWLIFPSQDPTFGCPTPKGIET